MEKHTITIQPNGDVSIKVEGLKGKACLEATREIEEAFGETTKRTNTAEFYEQPQRIKARNKA
ncbi:MAG TPA: DUF2997 domain-containing protein [Candidatus Angelobacter sp.]|nr:DUF2997 domain-containing protein [Candidatus Angelobacter sp.]